MPNDADGTDEPARFSLKGRGAPVSPNPRFLKERRESFDDGWEDGDEELVRPATTVTAESPRTIISRNTSPDIPFNQSINPYKGCEHGCVYCYARPTHAYLDLSPGLDFETRIFSKPNAAKLLRKELADKSYRCDPIVLGANTDPYQPVERRNQITRAIIEVLVEHRHPVRIITKSALVERDIDLLSPMAKEGLVEVIVSVTSLDRTLMRRLEPRAAAPQRRLVTIERLCSARIPCGTLFAPIIPNLNDVELETVLQAVAQAGASRAGFVLLRLPLEIKEIFVQWLSEHYPLKAKHVMALLREMRGGGDYDSQFGKRMRGTGVYAKLLEQRFAAACKRLGLKRGGGMLDKTRFCVPDPAGQLKLFQS